jgi:hypothetical protein
MSPDERRERAFFHFSSGFYFKREEKRGPPPACGVAIAACLIDMHIFAPLLLNLAAAAAAVVAAQIFAVGDSLYCMWLGLCGGKSHYDELERIHSL